MLLAAHPRDSRTWQLMALIDTNLALFAFCVVVQNACGAGRLVAVAQLMRVALTESATVQVCVMRFISAPPPCAAPPLANI